MESRSVCVYIAALALFCVPCLVTSESEDAMVTQGACPYPCTQGGHHYCFPLPCPLPPCAHPVKDAGACCSHCPTGKWERLTHYNNVFPKISYPKPACTATEFTLEIEISLVASVDMILSMK